MNGLPFFIERFGSRSVTGDGIRVMQGTLRDPYNLARDFPVDGRQFDVLANVRERLGFGSLGIAALRTALVAGVWAQQRAAQGPTDGSVMLEGTGLPAGRRAPADLWGPRVTFPRAVRNLEQADR